MGNRPINLLTKDDFNTTTLGKVSTWSLSVGRWIVVVTELIVIAAFAARFKLDREIADLTEEINQKQVVVNVYEPFEKKFRETQQRLTVLSQALNQQLNHAQLLEEISKSIPADVILNTIDLTDTQLTLTATALTEQGMGGMNLQMQTSAEFSQVTLTKLEVADRFTKGIKFEIKAKLKSVLKSET